MIKAWHLFQLAFFAQFSPILVERVCAADLFSGALEGDSCVFRGPPFVLSGSTVKPVVFPMAFSIVIGSTSVDPFIDEYPKSSNV